MGYEENFHGRCFRSDVLGGLILGQASPILFLYLVHLRATEHTRLPQQYITMGMEDARPCCGSALTDGIEWSQSPGGRAQSCLVGRMIYVLTL